MIIAVDFDGTLCSDEYPIVGVPNRSLILHLINRQRRGDIIVLWTCRCGESLEKAVKWCKMQGLKFDYINENVPEMIRRFGNDSRKIYADLYIDDKAANKIRYKLGRQDGDGTTKT